MEQYRVGQNVQAIDELGRWAEGKVADITEDGVEITFLGWGQENNVVLKPGGGGIRAPIHPFQFAVESAMTRRKRQKCMSEQHQLNLLSNLQAGDTVRYDGNAVTVKTVDRFKRSVKILSAGCYADVHVSSISLDDINEGVPAKKMNKKRPKRTKATKGPKIAKAVERDSVLLTSTGQCSSATSTAAVSRAASNPPEPSSTGETQEVSLFSAWDCESCHRVTIGDVCCLGDLQLDMVVFNITMDTDSFKSYIKGPVVKTDGTIEDEVVVQAAASKVVMKPSKKLAKEGLKRVKSHRKVIYMEFQQMMKSSAVLREAHRKDWVSHFLWREVRYAFECKSLRRSFQLGSYSHEMDAKMFNGLNALDQRHTLFSIRDGSLSNVDKIMPRRWDIKVREEQVCFVTAVRLALNRDDCIVGVIKTAVCRESIDLAKYRDELKKHVLAST